MQGRLNSNVAGTRRRVWMSARHRLAARILRSAHWPCRAFNVHDRAHDRMKSLEATERAFASELRQSAVPQPRVDLTEASEACFLRQRCAQAEGKRKSTLMRGRAQSVNPSVSPPA